MFRFVVWSLIVTVTIVGTKKSIVIDSSLSGDDSDLPDSKVELWPWWWGNSLTKFIDLCIHR